MEKIATSLKEIKKEEIDLIIDYLKNGKVIVYPTDTIYGLGCIATDSKAIDKIFKIKKRDKQKPLLILVKSWCMLKKYCYVSKKQDEYLRKVWPGPVSVILKSRGLLPKNLTSGSENIAVRLPSNEILIKIIRQMGVPITSTSVNISGKNNLTNISDVDKYFGRYVPDLIVDAGRISGKSSRLVDLIDINNIKVLRK